MVTASIVDGLGRGYQVKKNAEVDGKRKMIVSGLTTFDRLGREIAHFAPTTCDLNDFGMTPFDKTIQLDEVKYDKFDRPVEQTAFSKNSDAYTTYTSYEIEDGKLKTHVQDKNGEKNVLSVSTYTDGTEHTLKTVKEHKDKDGGAPATTIFDFDGIGQLLKVTDPAGAETKYEYDMAGRKLSVDNLSAGKTTFTYDNLGNVLTKTTGKGDVVTYQYEYNRLIKQTLGDNKWKNEVKYTYGGVDAKHNRVGRLALVEDGSGAQEYFYGKMGEVEKIRRTIIIPGIDVATYTTEWKYDSWNRIQEMIYPDGEKIKYYYNLGGQLQRILGQKNYICTYVDSIRYDKYEQRSYIKYGNGTETTYDYDPVNRRLDTMTVSNEKSKAEGAKGLFLNNVYKYDAAGNITSVENTAALNSGIGGTMKHEYKYDDWYRLIDATGKFVGSDNKSANYHLEMGYDNLYNITSKKMTMTQTNLQFAGTLSAGHEFSYNYSTDNPMQLASVETKQYNVDGTIADVDEALAKNIHTQDYEFDKNGNMTSVSVASLKPETQEPETTEATEEKDVLKSFLWDEENRLLAVNNNGSVSCYFYDAAGERTVKLTSETEMVHVNGKKVGGNDAVTKFTAYVSPYFVVSNGGAYTKHIYAASQRIASKLGNEDGFGADPRRVEQAGGKKISDFQKDNVGERFKALGYEYSAPEKEKVEKDSTMDSEAEEKLIFFYHPDHLGSTSYVTDADGNIVQHIEYIPYGEVFVEERNSQFSTNFLFNAKELDNETGLYYYGARYLDPTGAMWLSVDPMWEKYAGMSPYNYCMGNPVKLVDPDGNAFWAAGAAIGGAIIGGAVNGILTAMDPSTSKVNVIASIVGGAVSGAIAAGGASVGAAAVSGAAGSAVGNAIEQGINLLFDDKKTSYDLGETVVAAGTGALCNMAARGTSTLIKKNVEEESKAIAKDAAKKQAKARPSSDYKANQRNAQRKGISPQQERVGQVKSQRQSIRTQSDKKISNAELKGDVSNYVSDVFYSGSQNRSQNMLVEKCKLNEKINAKINENLGQ